MKQQWTSQVWGAALLVAVAAGCSSDNSTETNGNTAASGSPSSATAGAGPAATAGSPATAGGAAGAPAGGAATGPFACGPKSTKAPAELYNAMAQAFLPQDMSSSLPCAFGSCHNMGKKAAMLVLGFGGNLTELVGKKSCEVPTMDLVSAQGGDAALKNSWLYNKLAAPVDGSASLIPDPAWGTPGQCGQMGDFGMRMPISGGADGVGDAKLAIAKEWICAGAPGPM